MAGAVHPLLGTSDPRSREADRQARCSLNQWLSDEEGLSKSQSHKAKLLDGRNSPENMSTSAPAAAD